MTEAVTFALFDDHPETVLRLGQQDMRPPRNIDEEAQRLVDLPEQVRRAVRRYEALASPDDAVPF